MLVRMGNETPHAHILPSDHDGAPCEYTWRLPEGFDYTHEPEGRLNGKDALIHVLSNNVPHLPGHEAFVSVTNDWPNHSPKPPTWVWSDNEDLAVMLSEAYGCPVGRPDDVEDTHHTLAGPPGVGPVVIPEGLSGPIEEVPAEQPNPEAGSLNIREILHALANPFRAKPAWAARTNAGRDAQAIQMGGGVNAPTAPRTSTGMTATVLTDSGATFPTTGDSLAYRTVVCGTVEGVIISNTGTALTVYRWRNPATPGGANGTTPGATTAYVVSSSVAPWMFVGISANASPSSSDTALTGEIVTSGGGLIRKISPYAHTASATTYTLTPVFTANGSDSLGSPVTIASIGVFQDVPSTPTTAAGQPIFTTSLNATATITVSGDQLTVTETITTA